MLHERSGWRNPRVLTTLLMVFLAGALSGALVMQSVLHARMHGGGSGEIRYSDLQRDLNLTPKQAEQIQSILDDFVKYDQDLKNQIEDVRATGKNRIMAILDPGQKEQFKKICDRLQR